VQEQYQGLLASKLLIYNVNQAPKVGFPSNSERHLTQIKTPRSAKNPLPDRNRA